MLKGPQKLDLKDYSTACPIGLYIMQDEDVMSDSDMRSPFPIPNYGRPKVFGNSNPMFPYSIMVNLVEETDCFKDVADSKGVYTFIEKFKNFNTLRK